jgi:hypothetical protein
MLIGSKFSRRGHSVQPQAVRRPNKVKGRGWPIQGFPKGCWNLTFAFGGTPEPKVCFLARPRTHTAGHQ